MYKRQDSVYAYNQGIISNASLGKSSEHLEILLIIGFYFDLKDAERQELSSRLSEYVNDSELILEVLLKLQVESNPQDADYSRMHTVLSSTSLESLKSFIDVCVQINALGYINPEAIETAKVYYENNRGTSLENAAFRNFAFAKFDKFMSTLAVEDFNEYFELNKVFVVYMNLLDNEKFNQSIKGVSMTYVKKLLRTYTQKRSKDYQDIKKFVSSVFLDLGFLNEKQIKELFKTKRKKASA